MIEDNFKAILVDTLLLVPYDDSGLVSKLYDIASVNSIEYKPEGISISVSLTPEQFERYKNYVPGDE
jgi:GTP-binding protein HflX